MTPAEIISDVAARFGVTPDAIVGRLATRWVSRARKQAVLELRAIGLGVSDIGRLLGRNHSTIIYLASAHTAGAANGRR